jgi:hypothetical protein
VFVLAAILKYGAKGVINVKWYEGIIYILVMLCLTVVFAYHYIDLFMTGLAANAPTKDVVALCIEMCFMLAVVLLITFIYIFYYKPKYNKRLKTKPALQSKLNYEFRVLDG